MASTSQNSYTDTGLTNGTAYYYVVSALVAVRKAAFCAGDRYSRQPELSGGTIVGTTGAWGNSGNTREMAMDWNLNTFFDAPIATKRLGGLDLGTNSARVISKIRFCPRATWSSRMVGGVFQAPTSRTLAMPLVCSP